MTPRRSARADAQRRLRAAAPFVAPSSDAPFLPPSPTKLQQTSPVLTGQVCALYEDGAMPVAEIARLAGVAERTLYKYVARGGWRRRYQGRGAEAAAASRGRKRATRPPQPRGSGGRFVPPVERDTPHASGLKALDPQGAALAAAACERWGVMAGQAMARAIAFNDAERQARTFALVVRAMRDLAAITDGAPRGPRRLPRAASVKPRKPRRIWTPGLVTPLPPLVKR